MPPRAVHIIGVPLDLGAGRRGVDMGPSALRIAGIGEKLASIGCVVTDRGNLHVPVRETLRATHNDRKFIDEIAAVCTELYDTSVAALNAGALPLVLGGDHSLGAGSVAATAAWARQAHQMPVGVIWVDAHGDMNTPSTSPSGNVHGMPLAALLGSDPRELASIGGFFPTIDPRHTVLVGIRNLDEREKGLVRAAGVHVFTMKDIDRQGIASVMEQAVALASDGTAGLHMSFDMDSCDPTIAPGVGTPVKGGLDYREAHMVMELVADSGHLLALDLVEVNPTLDLRNTTAELGVELAMSALGQKIL